MIKEAIKNKEVPELPGFKKSIKKITLLPEEAAEASEAKAEMKAKKKKKEENSMNALVAAIRGKNKQEAFTNYLAQKYGADEEELESVPQIGKKRKKAPKN